MATLSRKVKGRSMTKVRSAPVAAIEEEALDTKALKAKKALELELPEEPIAISIEDKPEEDSPVVAEDAEELAAEEISLDDDELNPFGDKWEQ